MLWMLKRLIRILLVGIFLAMGINLVLVGLDVFSTDSNLWSLVQHPWHFLAGLTLLGAGVLFFEGT